MSWVDDIKSLFSKEGRDREGQRAGERVGGKDCIQSWTWRSIPWEMVYTGKKRIELRLEISRSRKQGNSERRAQERRHTHEPMCTVWIRKSPACKACTVSWAPEPPKALTPKPAGGCFLLSGQGNEVRGELEKRSHWGDQLPHHSLVPAHPWPVLHPGTAMALCTPSVSIPIDPLPKLPFRKPSLETFSSIS